MKQLRFVRKYTFILLVVPFMAAILVLATDANAIPWYGQDPAIKPGIPDFDWPDPLGKVGCGHVAAANVLWYWDTHSFSKLVDGKPTGNTFPTLMGNLNTSDYLGPDDYVSIQEMDEGIEKWFRKKNVELSKAVQGTTTRPGDIPTWDFYQQQLRKCEIPIVLIENGNDEGHWLTGVGWKDNKFLFHDPNKAGIGEEEYAWKKEADGYMHITYDDNDWQVSTIIAVTAVPEPGTLFLIGSGIVGILGLRRQRILKKA